MVVNVRIDFLAQGDTSDISVLLETTIDRYYFISNYRLMKRRSYKSKRRSSCPTNPEKEDNIAANLPAITIDDHQDELHNAGKGAKNAQSKKNKMWYKRMLQFKSDVEQTYQRVGSHIRSGLSGIRAQLSPAKRNEDPVPDSMLRRLTVHHFTKPKRRRSKQRDEDEDKEDSGYSGMFEGPEKNFTPSLLVHPLKEGKFSAQISLDNFHSDDDIIVKVRGYKLDILLQKRRACSPDGRDRAGTLGEQSSRPWRCGDIALPMYIDPNTLFFAVGEDSDLYIQGALKGSMGHRMFLSADDLMVNGVKPNVLQAKSFKEDNTHKSVWYLNKSKIDTEERRGSESPIRARSYTSVF